MQSSAQQKMFKSIDQWKRSGIPQKAWCAKNQLSYPTFHYWYKRYRDQATAETKNSSDNFIQLTVNDSVAFDYWCELSLANGKKLRFPQPVSAEFLKSLLA